MSVSVFALDYFFKNGNTCLFISPIIQAPLLNNFLGKFAFIYLGEFFSSQPQDELVLAFGNA